MCFENFDLFEFMNEKVSFAPIQIQTRGKYRVCYCDIASSTGTIRHIPVSTHAPSFLAD